MPRILVVDDRQSVLELMATILSSAHEVTTQSDPAAAMALLAQARFDLVLTDVCMPGADGFAVLAAVQRASPATPVVMMTGFASVPDAVLAIKKGAFDYVVKPLDADDVGLVVARALAESPGARGLARLDGEAPPTGPFKDAIAVARERASRDYLVALLTEFHGNVTRASERAGVTRESLHRLLKKHDVHSEWFKRG